jgi:magnesium transporter
LERTWSIIQGYREIVSGLDRTNEALASQRLNDIIKTLTVISVVTIVPSMIINIYSMNIRLPFATNTKIFFILTGIFFLIMLATYLTLRKRKLA